MFRLILLFLIITSSGAHAFSLPCKMPMEPMFYESKPINKPMLFCTININCSQRMIDEYNMEVEIYNLTVKRYNAEKEDYIQSMNRWLDEVFRYAKCKVDDLNEP